MRDDYQLSQFHRGLAEMCRSEVPLGRAFRMLDEDLRGDALRGAVRTMAVDVEAGVSLAEAYKKQGKVFPPLYAALIEAGTASGDLPGTLEEIARISAQKAELTSRVRRVLAYPVSILFFVVLMLWFLYTFIVPQFSTIFSQILDRSGTPIQLPAITRIVFNLPSMVPATILCLAVVVVTLSYLRDPIDGLRLPPGLLFRLPVLGPMRLNASLASLAATLAVGIRRGLPLDRALDLAAAAADGAAIRRAAEAMAKSAREGTSLSEAAREAGLLPPSMLWLLGTAEKQGYTAEALEEIARICRERVTRGVDAHATIVGPMAELLLGGIVGTIVLAVFYPILKLQSALM